MAALIGRRGRPSRARGPDPGAVQPGSLPRLRARLRGDGGILPPIDFLIRGRRGGGPESEISTPESGQKLNDRNRNEGDGTRTRNLWIDNPPEGDWLW